MDTAVLTVHKGRLRVLLVHADKAERLPGTFLHPDETLKAAALRALRDKAGVQGLDPQQLRVFDRPDRDDRGWVLSVAHLDAVRADQIPANENTRLVAVDEVPRLSFDHAEIVQHAASTLRAQYRDRPDPWRLLAASTEGFTIRDLRLLHQTVLGEQLVADTFRRTMLPHLVPLGATRRGARGKPAELFLTASTPAAAGPEL